MLNILVVTPAFEKSLSGADPECMRRIRSVSPEIKVKDAAALVAAEFRGDNSQKKKLDSLLAWAHVIFGLAAPPDTVARAPNLKWIQVISAGVDRWMATDVWTSSVILTGRQRYSCNTGRRICHGADAYVCQKCPVQFPNDANTPMEALFHAYVARKNCGHRRTRSHREGNCTAFQGVRHDGYCHTPFGPGAW